MRYRTIEFEQEDSEYRQNVYGHYNILLLRFSMQQQKATSFHLLSIDLSYLSPGRYRDYLVPVRILIRSFFLGHACGCSFLRRGL